MMVCVLAPPWLFLMMIRNRNGFKQRKKFKNESLGYEHLILSKRMNCELVNVHFDRKHL